MNYIYIKVYFLCFNNYVIVTEYIPAVHLGSTTAAPLAPGGEPFDPGVSAVQGEPAPVAPVVPGRQYQVHQQFLHQRISFCNTVIYR